MIENIELYRMAVYLYFLHIISLTVEIFFYYPRRNNGFAGQKGRETVLRLQTMYERRLKYSKGRRKLCGGLALM